MESIVRSAKYTSSSLDGRMHHHDCHEIIFVTDGSAETKLDGRKRTIRRGDILIVSRFEEHFVGNISSDYKRYILFINPAIKSGGKQRMFSLLFNRPKGFSNIVGSGSRMREIEDIFKRIIAEKNESKDLQDDMLELLVSELLIMIYRCSPKYELPTENAAYTVVLQIQETIAENIKKQYSLNAMSREYGISVSSLSHNFKRITGMSVMEYIFSCRFAEAKKMLVGTSMSIGEIVEECGFSDCSNFGRTFKRQFGMSPSKYRAKYSAVR